MALKEGMITSKIPIDPSQIQPVSLDLRLGQRAYRIQCIFFLKINPVDTRLKDLTLYEFDISNGGILEKKRFINSTDGRIKFIFSVLWFGQSKKLNGRLDMFTRVIVDGDIDSMRFREGIGVAFIEVIPRSFPVRVKTGFVIEPSKISSCYFTYPG
ncbi:MAG: hypothetical protein CM1200mP16_10410 [Nitrospina sp.]|nr:MAG: hypothetical protein CM1200mP16_10410 [Nitrospina sp.]